MREKRAGDAAGTYDATDAMEGAASETKSAGSEHRSPGKEASDVSFTEDSISEDELLRESSGAAKYSQIAEAEYAKRMRHSVEADPRIPAGGGHTEDEYLALPDDLRVELVDGVFYAMASPSRIHQTTVLEIARQLADCIDNHDEPCYIYTAPSDVALGNDKKTVVQPDIYVHCDREKDIAPGPYRGAPDLTIEILSPSNPEHDLWRKRELYRRHGVREYWIVDPRSRDIYVFLFDEKREKKDTEEAPERYTFDDVIPVGISGGSCRVDFKKIFRKIQHFPED